LLDKPPGAGHIAAALSKLAFLYPGQGSQKVGMGAELLEEQPELFDRYVSVASEASGLPIRELCLEGPMEKLTETEAAQPALFALSLAITDAARSAGLRPDFVAGHSLGEYTAAASCGALGIDDGMRVVAERGRLMQGIQSERPGAMAAVIGLDAERVEELCRQASEAGLVAPANLNSPSQTVASGEEAGVERLIELAQEAGAKRALRLRVGAAFHSKLMEPVQARLEEVTSGLDWSEAEVPLAANFSGELVSAGEDVRRALIAQIASPVRWVDCVKTLSGAGCTTFLELGPGRVLSGLVKQIDPELETVSADSPAALREFADSHRDYVAGQG
jgi:[acyl-carrier-protein] S-malonyltransferase